MATPTATATPNKYDLKTPTLYDKTPPSESYLCTFTYLSKGLNPAKIVAQFNIPKTTIQSHVSKLKQMGCIRKAGYGTWDILKQPESTEKRSAITPYVGTPQHPPHRTSRRTSRRTSQAPLGSYSQDAIRTHAMTTTWQVPGDLNNWNNKKRTQYLDSHGILHIQLGICGGGQRIIIKDGKIVEADSKEGNKIWLLDRVIMVYDKSSYYAETALDGKNRAIAKHLSIIKHIERLLHVSFEIGSDRKFKVSRQHHALIHNDFAKHINEAGETLEVRDGRGLWLLIDDSKDEEGQGMNELEAVRSESDATKTQAFFNSLKTHPITTDFILTAMAGIQANQAAFAENMLSHIEAVRNLSTGVKRMTAAINQFKQP